jgi:tRNA-binding EMAP/Myf-like protein
VDGKAAAPAAPAAKKDGGKEGGKAGKGKDAAAAAASAVPAGGKAAEEEATIDMLDCRVGRIVKVDKHPNADALYLEEVRAQCRKEGESLHRFPSIPVTHRPAFRACSKQPSIFIEFELE